MASQSTAYHSFPSYNILIACICFSFINKTHVRQRLHSDPVYLGLSRGQARWLSDGNREAVDGGRQANGPSLIFVGRQSEPFRHRVRPENKSEN